jgi:hypothetical protein
MIDTITGIIIGVIGLGLYWAGFATAALLAVSQKEDKPISCEICRHSKRGRANAYDKNCAKCLCEGAFTGFERKG